MRNQKTLTKAVSFEGIGVHTGEPSKVTCHPAGEDEGIVFERTDLEGRPKWFLRNPRSLGAFAGEGHRSRLGSHLGQIETVEHLLATLWGLGISNLRVEVEGPEIPILDGSAEPFVRAFTEAGLETQKALRPLFAVSEPLFVHAEKAAILMLPQDTFRVTYTLDYDHPQLKGQTVSFDLTERVFIEEIAPARTFCTEEEAQALLKQGLGKGGSYDNALVIGDAGPVQNTFRFPDECARHKVLDLVGDLSLLGLDLRAHVIAIRSGHTLNHKMRDLLLAQKESYYESIRG